MGINAREAFNSPLSLWSSLYQDMNPIDLPEGLSPANEDMWFIPGSVGTRPALNRLLVTPISGNPTMMSVWDFPQPNGDFAAVFLDSAGDMHKKLASTGAVTDIEAVAPGVQFKASNAFNKQWYAFFGNELAADFSENPFVGVDIPRYNDGQDIWRVTYDAPGLPPAAADYSLSYTIAAAGVPGAQVLADSNSVSGTESGHLVTLTYGSPFSIKPRVGDLVVVSGMSVAGYNGTFTLTAVTNSTLQYINPLTGLAAGTGGTATIYFLEFTTTAANQFADGDMVTVSAVTVAGYDGTYTIRRALSTTIFIVPAAPAQFALGNSGTGTVILAGSTAAGPRQMVVAFKSLNGAITGVSIPTEWTSGGGVPGLITQIPLGPTGTVQRILAFSPAYGSNFYYIAPSIVPSTTGGAPTVSQGTIVDDNTSTQFIVDFSDQELLAGQQIDIEGNDLFEQIVLAPCLGVIEYQSRLFWWGEINNIKNFLNMGFDGGTLVLPVAGIPLGWSSANSGGGTATLIDSTPANMGFSYKMTSAHGSTDCMIEQPAYQDYYGAPILQANKSYLLRLKIDVSSTPLTSVTGYLTGEFYSANSGSLATAAILLSTIPRGVPNIWVTQAFNAALPAAIPSDTVFRIYLDGALNTLIVTIDDVEIIDANQPVLAQQMRASYVANPFGYDALTGSVGIDSTDSITAAFTQRGYLYPIGNNSLFLTQNNGSTEPAEWTVSEFAQVCGCCSPCAVSSGEGVSIWAGRYGRFLFAGDTPKKISQEIQPTWDRINWAVETRIWLVNDPVERIIYTGLPLDAATAPSHVQPVSYRSVDSAYNIPDPLFTVRGKVTAGDLCRKSTIWNVKANCGAMVTQPLLSGEGTAQQMVFGGGNGQAPGLAIGFGELYNLDFDKFTDDDYGVIGGGTGNYYITYAHWPNDIEQNVPQLGLHRKIYTFLSAFATGVGNLQITALVDSLTNPAPALRPYALLAPGQLKHDLEWGLNITGDRVFFKIQPVPFATAPITNISLEDNVLTVSAVAQYSIGMQIALSGLTTATFLNGQTVTITSVSSTGFTADFTHVDYASTPDTGVCTPPSTTDAALNINHMVVAGRMDKIFPVRGAYL